MHTLVSAHDISYTKHFYRWRIYFYKYCDVMARGKSQEQRGHSADIAKI